MSKMIVTSVAFATGLIIAAGLWGITSSNAKKCAELKENYMTTLNGVGIAESLSYGGGQSRAIMATRMNIARNDLMKSCGNRAVLETEEEYIDMLRAGTAG